MTYFIALKLGLEYHFLLNNNEYNPRQSQTKKVSYLILGN